MTNPNIQTPEPTAVDDVRRVREKIDREHGSDLQGHVEETTRIAAAMLAQLNVRRILAPKGDSMRRGPHA